MLGSPIWENYIPPIWEGGSSTPCPPSESDSGSPVLVEGSKKIVVMVEHERLYYH
jgi:hypothetical protein